VRYALLDGFVSMMDHKEISLLSWTGDFSTRGWEEEFQAAQLKSRAARIRVICIVTGIAYLAAAYPNYLILGPSAGFFFVLAMRMLAFAAGMTNFYLASNEKHHHVLPFTMAGYMLLIGASESIELLALAGLAPMEGVPFTVIIVLIYYAFLPLRLLPSAFAAIGTSVMFILAMAWGTPSSLSYVILTALFFVLANTFGIYFLISYGRSQRNEFRALCEERQANKLLHEEISLRKEIEKRLLELATTDELTGVSNRRHFFNMSRRELNRAYRHHLPLSVLMIDADDFKSINDQLGHEAGDLTLQALADACLHELRQEDLFGRLGGEEFGACLPDTSMEQALIVAERMRQSVEDLEVETGSGTARVTISIGVSSKGEDNLDLAQLLSKADRELYRAKGAGRNIVVSPQLSLKLGGKAKVRAVS
jgi:diguanylate cyclase (GGDEF)-like protein